MFGLGKVCLALGTEIENWLCHGTFALLFYVLAKIIKLRLGLISTNVKNVIFCKVSLFLLKF